LTRLFVLLSHWKILGGLYLGWGVGANDSANIFGTAVATNSIRFRTAVILISVLAVIGSVVEGPALYNNVKFHGSEVQTSGAMALAATFAAGLAVMIVTIWGIPASTSQAAVGGMMGIAIFSSGFHAVDWGKLGKMGVCWLLTPIGGAFFGYLLYRLIERRIVRLIPNPQRRSRVIRWLLILSGSYGAYTLGANNVVVTTVSYYQSGMFGEVVTEPYAFKTLFMNPIGWFTDPRVIAAAIGAASIALGALTYSKNVMETVGKKITVLDPLAALISVLAHSLTLQIFTALHVPVSSSQAIVGGVIGVGLVKGARTISKKELGRIFAGWIATPLSSALAAYLLALLFC
jgi:PiT family inorganic phosphate transporter